MRGVETRREPITARPLMLRVVGHLPGRAGSGALPGPAGVRQPLTRADLQRSEKSPFEGLVEAS